MHWLFSIWNLQEYYIQLLLWRLGVFFITLTTSEVVHEYNNMDEVGLTYNEIEFSYLGLFYCLSHDMFNHIMNKSKYVWVRAHYIRCVHYVYIVRQDSTVVFKTYYIALRLLTVVTFLWGGRYFQVTTLRLLTVVTFLCGGGISRSLLYGYLLLWLSYEVGGISRSLL